MVWIIYMYIKATKNMLNVFIPSLPYTFALLFQPASNTVCKCVIMHTMDKIAANNRKYLAWTITKFKITRNVSYLEKDRLRSKRTLEERFFLCFPQSIQETQ